MASIELNFARWKISSRRDGDMSMMIEKLWIGWYSLPCQHHRREKKITQKQKASEREKKGKIPLLRGNFKLLFRDQIQFCRKMRETHNSSGMKMLNLDLRDESAELREMSEWEATTWKTENILLLFFPFWRVFVNIFIFRNSRTWAAERRTSSVSFYKTFFFLLSLGFSTSEFRVESHRRRLPSVRLLSERWKKLRMRMKTDKLWDDLESAILKISKITTSSTK